MRLDVILRVVTKIFAPFILLFALYVHLHGDFGPGGGFQAGVAGAAMVFLYAIMVGLDAARRAVPPAIVEFMVPLGVLIFAGVGVVNMVLGANFLDYSSLDPADPPHGEHVGILLVELGVLVTVFGTMVVLFYAFAGRGQS